MSCSCLRQSCAVRETHSVASRVGQEPGVAPATLTLFDLWTIHVLHSQGGPVQWTATETTDGSFLRTLKDSKNHCQPISRSCSH